MKSLPNILTIFRIVTLPILILLILSPDLNVNFYSLILFIIISASDFFDGYFARMMNVESNFGKMLDPIADKLLVAAIILILTSKGVIADWETIPALIILLREITVSGLREYLAGIKVSIPVSRIAKLKTLLQLCALALLILSESVTNFSFIIYLGKIFLWFAGMLTLYTAYDYVKASIRHF